MKRWRSSNRIRDQRLAVPPDFICHNGVCSAVILDIPDRVDLDYKINL